MRDLSIIIPSKSVENLGPCVDAIQAKQKNARVIIVWDGEWPVPWSTPNAPWSVPFEGKRITVVRGEKPFVFARNINVGIREAGRDDVVLLNDDALLRDHNGFMAMQDAWFARQEFAIIGAVTNVTGQPLQMPNAHPVGLREVPHIAFVCVFIPRVTIMLLGGLDERYSIDYGVEDRDYCEAVARAGMKVGVYDYCFVDHGSLKSSFRGDPHTPKSFARNYELFKQKWGIE